MVKMKFAILVCVFVALSIENAHCGMTEAQFKNAAKLLRNLCQPKLKISSAQIEAMHRGEFTGSQIEQCYAECILRTGQIMKDGKLNMEFLYSQLAGIPANVGDPGRVSADNCKSAPKSADKCTAAYEFYKCFYDDNPENFFIP